MALTVRKTIPPVPSRKRGSIHGKINEEQGTFKTTTKRILAVRFVALAVINCDWAHAAEAMASATADVTRDVVLKLYTLARLIGVGGIGTRELEMIEWIRWD